MLIGVISEDKNDYDAVGILIRRIANEKVDTMGSAHSGKSGIIHAKKLHVNYFFNFNCDAVIIILDSDGASETKIVSDIKSAYDSTRIGDRYHICIAVEELEAWFLTDTDALRQTYKNISMKATGISQQCIDNIHDPKGVLKNYVERWSRGMDKHLESDSKYLAENIDLSQAFRRSPSFRNFHDTITKLTHP